MDQTLTSIEPEKSYLFFTVTYYFVGTVVRVTPTDVLLRDCWLIYGIPGLETFLKAPTKANTEESAYLGDFVLSGRIGARPMATAMKGP